MNNNTIPAASTGLTEADVKLWLRDIAAKTGIDGTSVEISSSDFMGATVFLGQGETRTCGIGYTITEAMTKAMKNRKTPDQLATEKRAEAKRLLAEADAINPQPVNPAGLQLTCNPDGSTEIIASK